MQRQWFQPEIAGALRGHIRTLILELFISQASTMVRVALMKLPLNTPYIMTNAHGRWRGRTETQAAKTAALLEARAALRHSLCPLSSPDSIGHKVLLHLVTL